MDKLSEFLYWLQGIKWWVWAGIGLIVLVLILQAGDGSTRETVNEGQSGGDSVADDSRQRVIEYVSEALTFLSLEYGIRLDEETLRSMLSEDETAFTDLGAGEWLTFTFLDWWDSPSDKADRIRDLLLEDGQVPKEAMQNLADRLATYKRTAVPE